MKGLLLCLVLIIAGCGEREPKQMDAERAQTAEPVQADEGSASRAGFQTIRVRPLSESQAEYQSQLEQSYGVFVGVEQFDDGSFTDLKYSVEDATALREVFVEELKLLKMENTLLLVSDSSKEKDQPTKNNILVAVDWAAKNAGPQGCVVVSYSSHGLDAYLLAKDSVRQLLADTTVELNRLKELLSKAKTPRRLLLLDACREIPETGIKSMSGGASEAFASAFKGAEGFYVLQATAQGCFSYEDDEFKMGIMTHYFLEGVRGKAPANAAGMITLNGVVNWATTEVEKATSNRPRGKQSPRLSLTEGAGEFPLALGPLSLLGPPDLPNSIVKPVIETKMRYGSLKVSSLGGGTLYLDNELIQAIRPYEEATLSQIPAGYREIRIVSKGFEEVQERFLLEPDQVWSKTYRPKELPVYKPAVPTRVERQAGARKEVVIKGVSFAFRWCPPGRFLMGSPASEPDRDDDESQHEVVLSRGYWLQETELTQRQWAAVMGTNPSTFKGEDRPVEQVSWEDAQAFIRAANAALGGGLRLPTEAEWEYACRAGKTGAYAGSLERMGWFGVNSGSETHPVGQKEANAWGLKDLHGNVWEWCSDWYEAYPGGKTQDPVGPSTGRDRVDRGGSWYDSAGRCRSTNRSSFSPAFRYRDLGFRLALGQP